MVSKTIICHFYNEEYLLPWWLKHHRKIFDHGIMIDYASTDRSRELIKELCPTWEIIDSRNSNFGAYEIDSEIHDIERRVAGWRIVLNVTEFLYGDYDVIGRDQRQEISIPCTALVDLEYGRDADQDQDLLIQCDTGVSYKTTTEFRFCRAARNFSDHYPIGRHFKHIDTTDLIVFWTGFAPWNDRLMERRNQIKSKQASSDLNVGLGLQHALDREGVFDFWRRDFLPRTTDIRGEIAHMVRLHTDALGYF